MTMTDKRVMCADCGVCYAQSSRGLCTACESYAREEEEREWRSLDETCSVCGAAFHSMRTFQTECSDECEKIADAIEAGTGVCGWCGRYGKLGTTCVRRVPGTDEMDECGVFG
jgi:hypothetical protein